MKYQFQKQKWYILGIFTSIILFFGLGAAYQRQISGPSSSTDNAVLRWNGTGGFMVKNSTMTIDDSGNVTITGNLDVVGTASFVSQEIGTLTVTNPISVASGGTESDTAAGARTNLGLIIGVDVAPVSSPTLTAPTLNDGVTFEQTTPSAFSAVTNWVADPTVSQYQYIATATNVNFLHATNAAAGRQTVFLIGRNAAGTSTVTIPADLFAYNTNTVDVAENEFVAVSFYFYGADNTNVVATIGNVYSR